MCRAITIVVALVLSHHLYSQKINTDVEDTSKDDWKNAEVILKTGDTLACLASYHPLETGFIIKVDDGPKITNYNPRHVERFSYHDNSANKYKYFLSILNQGDMSFMEILFEDSIFFILKAEAIYHRIKDHYTTTQFGTFRTHSTPEVLKDQRRYIANRSLKEFKPLTRRTLLSFMLDKEREMKNFIYENNLPMKDLEDYVKVINQYHQVISGK